MCPGHTVTPMRSTAVVIAAVLISSCAGNGTTPTDPAPTTSTSSATPTSTLPPVVECPGVGDFEEGRGIADISGEGSDSRTLGQISWDTSDQCETFHFDFETSEGAPATAVPAITVDHLDSFQIIRISMDIEDTVITDQLVETNLVDRLYVVRSLSGRMFVDLHLAAPAAVRAAISSSPARLSIDLRPGFVEFTGQTVIGDQIVLTSPVTGAEVDSDVQFLGYSRTFEANVIAIVSQGGEVAATSNTTAADYLETWGEYRMRVDMPSGPVSVFLGEESPDDGELDGLTVVLTVR